MRLELTSREAAVLASLLDTTLSDLSYEIANTDGLDYREHLKARRAVLRKLRDAVQSEGQEEEVQCPCTN
jgi:hypothetical protein